MLEFPKLRSGVTVQHPLTCKLQAETRVLKFLDGRQQRFPAKKPQRKWTVHLELMDEEEAWALEDFARRHFETAEPFRFTDPRTGVEYAHCYLAGKEFEVAADGPMKRRCTLVVVEGGD
jgi:phage-related protein